MNSTSVDIWFRFYIDRFMSLRAQGIKPNLICGLYALEGYYWKNGPFSDDIDILKKISQFTPNTFEKNRHFFLKYFQVSNGQWHCARLDTEKENALSNHAARVNGGQITQDKKRKKQSAEQAAKLSAQHAADRAIDKNKGININIDNVVPLDAIKKIWSPSADALLILERENISRNFIDDSVAEFVLFWSEHQAGHIGAWNNKFIRHVRKQWAELQNKIKHERLPLPIAANWKPSNDAYDILRTAQIDIAFARDQLHEFILYWRDIGKPYGSWDTKFLQHVKYQWATRHHLTNLSRSNAAPARADNTLEHLFDRSWAVGLVAEVE